MIELFTTAFITLAVIIDPPGCAPIFASLTGGSTAVQRRWLAIRSATVAWCILMFFALLGEPLLRTLGISLSAFRLAGGIMLFMIALDMGSKTPPSAARARQGNRGDAEAEDIRLPMPSDDAGPADRFGSCCCRARRRPVEWASCLLQDS